jgi:hypothetical protein
MIKFEVGDYIKYTWLVKNDLYITYIGKVITDSMLYFTIENIFSFDGKYFGVCIFKPDESSKYEILENFGKEFNLATYKDKYPEYFL